MLLIRPCHTAEFLRSNNLGVEAHITRYDRLPDWNQYIPFVHGVHLPYAEMNLAAFDDDLRSDSLQKLKSALDEGCKYPVDRMVMHTIGIESIGGKTVGSYARMISGLQEFADYAASKKIILCIENQVAHPPEQVCVFGDSAKEWFQIQKDVNRENVLLTLDSSHAATSVAVYETFEERVAHIFDFLTSPELIGRIHWSDSRLKNNESRFNDMHLIPGEGDLPREFHKAIKELKVIKTLEQRRSEPDVIKGLAFIESL
jgi:sugar phosphate isomerase/epimerase